MPNKWIYGCILPCDLKVCKQISQLLFLYKLISNRDFSPKRIGKQGEGPWLWCTQWPEVWKERDKAGDWARSLENREDSRDIEQNQLETPAKQRMPIQGTGWKGRLRFSKLPFFDSGMCPGELFRKISKSHSEGPNVASCKISSKKEKRKESRRGGEKSQSRCLSGREKKVSGRSW